MANTFIQLKHSVISGNTPESLANGEIAINTHDGIIFYSTPAGQLKSIVTFPGPTGLNGEIQFNDSGVLGANGELFFTKSTGQLQSKILKSNSYIEFGDGTKQYTANAGTGGGGGSSVTISNTAPIGASSGDLWWDEDIGTLFIYYDDGDSLQWVEASPQILVEGPAGTYTLNGNLITTGDTTIQGTLYETSDASLKKDINTIISPLEITNNLRGVNFKWIKNNKQSMGMIAQEVEEVIPYLVQSDATDTKTINYTAMIGLLIESIKELDAKIVRLEKKKSIWHKIKDRLNGN